MISQLSWEEQNCNDVVPAETAAGRTALGRFRLGSGMFLEPTASCSCTTVTPRIVERLNIAIKDS